MEKENIKKLVLKNKTCKMSVTFLPNCVLLEERMTVCKLSKNINKQPCKYKKLKNGKYSLHFEFIIPNGFIFDALCVNDERTKEIVSAWLDKMIDDISEQRANKDTEK